MSGGAAPPSPTRARHHLSRSTTEKLPGATYSRQNRIHSSHHHHHHITGHIPTSLHRRDRSRDGRSGSIAVPQSAAPMLQHVSPRNSLDVPRPSPGLSSPDQSHRGSLLLAGGVEIVGAAGVPLSREELVERERIRAAARTAGLKKSLVDLTNFSTTTNRRLDEAYYSVLQRLTALQNTIVALRDLAQASKATSAGFIAESQSVLDEAQAQLDSFGDFSEQQGRVQALQDRVHGGRERIDALSQRVDVVRQRVERWERADREWQERTRRKLKIVWGVVLGLGLLMVVLNWGARAYAPEIEGVVQELKGDAVVAKAKLEPKSGDAIDHVKLGNITDGENGSLPALNFSKDREIDSAGDEALRLLDEL